MSLFSGLEKFGTKSAETMEKKENAQTGNEEQEKGEKQEKQQKKAVPPEADFLLPKT